MAAQLIRRERIVLSENEFVELVLWRLPEPVVGCTHCFKYRLAYVQNRVCVLRYDNERGKGDHFHYDGQEFIYVFKGSDQLISDFKQQIERWKNEHRSI